MVHDGGRTRELVHAVNRIPVIEDDIDVDSFGEAVREILLGRDGGGDDLLLLFLVTSVEVPELDMLRALAWEDWI